MSQLEANKEVVRRLYEEVFNQNRPEVLDELVAPDFTVNDDVPGRPSGPAALAGTNTALHGGFPDLKFTIDDLVAEGDRVAVRWTMRGTNDGPWGGGTPTGKVIALHANLIFNLRDGKLTDAWPVLDQAGLAKQLAATG
jgi:steroid delta-isomerase-like uncharacterized protein